MTDERIVPRLVGEVVARGAVVDASAAPSGRAARPASPVRQARKRALIRTLKVLATVLVLYFIFLSIPGLRQAVTQLSEVNPPLLVLGLVLQLLALFAYTLMTRAALGPSGHHLSNLRLFRIQLSTRALSSLMPGGSAAGSALGYRLLNLSGVPGPDAGFALATAGLSSAVVLNLLLWFGLVISIPLRGVNPLYGSAAIIGVILMGAAGALVFGLMEGQGRAERFLRWLARRLRLDEERVGRAVRHVATRLEDLSSDRQLIVRVGGWALVNWLLDAASLWVFLRAFGGSVPIDGLIVAFGLANVLAVIPLTPGGLGIVEGVYVPVLVGFGLTRATAVVGVVSYRLAQLWFPMLLGGLCYLSLRVGPWSIERRERLRPLRDVVGGTGLQPSKLAFSERYSIRDRTGQVARPDVVDLDEIDDESVGAAPWAPTGGSDPAERPPEDGGAAKPAE